MRILISGAGIAGHTLACALARFGLLAEIIEIRPNWDIVGAGMYMQCNALRALDRIGVADRIVASGWSEHGDRSIFLDMDGNPLAEAELPRIPDTTWPPVAPIRRSLLHDILHQAAIDSGIDVRMGTSITALRETPEGVEVEFSDGRRGSYDLVVGADGIHSRVRSLVFPETAVTFSGFANWRVLLARPEHLRSPVWQVGPDTSLGLIPISREHLYLAAVTKEPGNPWFERDQLPALLRERFEGYGGIGARMLAQVARPEQIVYTPIEEVILPEPWHKQHVVVLGDAAHASTPFWAQGASMAIEDCVVLAELLASGEPTPQVLEKWGARRYERCLFVQEGSKRAGEAMHSGTPETLTSKYERLRNNVQADINRRYARLHEPV